MSTFEHTSQAAAWKASDFPSAAAYTVALDDDDRRELLAAVRALPAGIPLTDTRRAAFPLPRLAQRLAEAERQVREGRGFVLFKGLPTGGTLDDFIGATWAIGTAFGEPLSQNPAGDRVGHVLDASATDATPRMYRSNLELRLHNDITAMISLSCWNPSHSGGVSVIASAVTLHDALRTGHPELLAALYRGFHYHLLGEEADGAEPTTPFRVPVFAVRNGQLSARYLRSNLAAGHQARGIPLTELEIAALNELDRVSTLPEHRLAFFLERGDMLMMNNYTMMHARTRFSNFPEPERRRHLVRLWLDAPGFRDVPREFWFHGVNGVPPQPGKRITMDFKKLYRDDPVATGGVADLKISDEMVRSR